MIERRPAPGYETAAQWYQRGMEARPGDVARLAHKSWQLGLLEKNERRVEPLSENVVLGLACPYNVISRPVHDKNGKRYREILRPGCFAASLHNVKLLPDHDSRGSLASTESRTLSLHDKHDGLHFTAFLSSGWGFVERMIREGKRAQASVTFHIKPEDVTWDRSGPLPVRHVHRARLEDITLVHRGAYRGTLVSVEGGLKIVKETDWKTELDLKEKLLAVLEMAAA